MRTRLRTRVLLRQVHVGPGSRLLTPNSSAEVSQPGSYLLSIAMLQLVKDLQGAAPRGLGSRVIGCCAVGVAEMRQHHSRVEAIHELAAEGSCFLKAAHGRSQVAEAIVGLAQG